MKARSLPVANAALAVLLGLVITLSALPLAGQHSPDRFASLIGG